MRTSPGFGWLGAAYAALAVVLAIALVRLEPPPPKTAEAPPGEFSAGRADKHLLAITAHNEPRPVGSGAVGRARAYAEDELVMWGYETEVQKGMSCAPSGACALVRNLVARRRGTTPGAGAVLLMAHLDSVPASAGASDDGLGVASVLEAARALAKGPPLARPIVVLISDGEEAGLLGARLFHAHHQLARTVHAVVNVEARGSRGPSMLFETLGNDRALAVARGALSKPVTSSLFAEAYRRMPNDTDFSIFREAPGVGVNFANVLGVEDYHTGRDGSRRPAASTLQHHGEQALASARAYAAEGVLAREEAEAHHRPVWFDVLATFVIAWPGWATLPLALFALALAARNALRARISGRDLAVLPAALVAGASSAAALGLILRAAGALPAPWVATPLPAVLALSAAATLAAFVAARFASPSATSETTHASVWLAFAALGAAAAVVAPGTSYVFVVPALVAVFFGFAGALRAAFVATITCGVLWLPLAPLVYAALGVHVPAVTAAVALLLAVTMTPFVPLLPRSRAGLHASLAGLAIVVTCALVACFVPTFTADHPQRVNVVVRAETGGPARLFVMPSWGPMPWGPAPTAMLRALGPGVETAEAPGGLPSPSVGIAPLTSHGPEVSNVTATTEGGRRMVKAHVRPGEGADVLVFALPRGQDRAVDLDVAGVRATFARGMVHVRGVGLEGVAVAFGAAGVAPLELDVASMTRGVGASAEAKAVVLARPPEATPTQDGDVTIVSSGVRW